MKIAICASVLALLADGLNLKRGKGDPIKLTPKLAPPLSMDSAMGFLEEQKEFDQVKQRLELEETEEFNMRQVRAYILKFTNEFRASESSLPPLKDAPDIDPLAQGHANDEAAKQQCSHDNVDARFDTMIKKLRCMGVAENVAMNPTMKDNIVGNPDRSDEEMARQIVDGWIASPGHRKNLLGNYKYLGIGTSKSGPAGSSYIYSVQLFCKK
uniref:SCP domain-containing protein n=1 Tax=Chromera velia CCMP2878 TaxID=1169474 RepID=A0A0G4F3D8_9ALVE|eukprot:Cvel_14905.t1-p1 / transcript=Cvel_14905.t1 / gene=Cvel_14905 / organism=Chromera_velia_CCMP2878 / gene_product=hypothetical protein / transcript_product=hypothetical protein / location=Cvel_scaffold1080:14813-15445(+) / protein_length=211 / sequence_SO=supercontig / SO=protein_coding / is_pseudo=false